MVKQQYPFFISKADNYLFALSTAILVSFVFVFQTNSLSNFIKVSLISSLILSFLTVCFFILSGIRNQARTQYKEKLFSELKQKTLEQLTPLIENVARPLGRVHGSVEVAIETSQDNITKKILTKTLKDILDVEDGTKAVGGILAKNINYIVEDTRNKALLNPIPGEKYSKLNYFCELLSEKLRYPTFFASMLFYLVGILLAFIEKN